MPYHAICPECKNDINLDQESINEKDHFECPTCGITLEARNIKIGSKICEIQEPEIIEEEK